MRKFRNTKGFTLIELMIVVVIIGILAALAIPRFGAASARAKEKEADGILKSYYTMQQAYSARSSVFADTEARLVEIGWQPHQAADLRHYQPLTVDQAATKTMTKTGAGYCDRVIDMVTGNITSGAC